MDILPYHQGATYLTLLNCTSQKWGEVGQSLCQLSRLRELTLRDCDAGDAICQKLANCTSLLSLTLGTLAGQSEHCGVTEEGVQWLSGVSQLIELRISNTLSMQALLRAWQRRPTSASSKVWQTLELWSCRSL